MAAPHGSIVVSLLELQPISGWFFWWNEQFCPFHAWQMAAPYFKEESYMNFETNCANFDLKKLNLLRDKNYMTSQKKILHPKGG